MIPLRDKNPTGTEPYAIAIIIILMDGKRGRKQVLFEKECHESKHRCNYSVIIFIGRIKSDLTEGIVT